MAVRVAAASIDERGKISGGKAGNQSGSELRIRKYYVHSKGWRVLRCIYPEARKYIAEAAIAAVKNKNIGYDQAQRDSLYNLIKSKGFDPAQANKACETDCSALGRVCASYGLKMCGKYVEIPNFNTSNEASVLLKTGAFVEMTGSKYQSQSDYLCAGDILVTKTKGHCEIVIDNGSKAEIETVPVAPTPEPTPTPTPTTDGKMIEVTGASVNIRFGPGTEYGVVKIVKDGDKFKAVDTDGWRPIVVGNVVCWISEKYSKQV